MADARTVFVTLEDVSSQQGVPLHRALEGDAAAGKNAHGALVAKRQDTGVLRYIPLTDTDQVPVTLEDSNRACLTDEGGVAGSTSFQDIATIPLTDGATYKRIGFVGSCFRDAVFEVLWVDDVGGADTETVLCTFRVGAGHYNHSEELDCMEFVAGTTAELRIRAKQLQSISSDIDGMISALEIQ